uniref:Uncharacterized protein n=1 Tax=Nelumbo nucifera TaxID=4432 RepID=A0A822YED5_NELNU|nr:TPA_asm: hypothetical protein HUJ06_031329 [Nelumbo nucifera]
MNRTQGKPKLNHKVYKVLRESFDFTTIFRPFF